MKRILFLLSLVLTAMSALSANFVIEHGQTSKLYVTRTSEGTPMQRADRLLVQDYTQVFGVQPQHTQNIADARIIACTYDNAELRRYAKTRGISFERLAGLDDAFILKVNNGGRQLFVVGSDELGVAHGLMTLSRLWGVSPLGEWVGAPAPALPRFELNVVFEQMSKPSVRERVLAVNASQPLDPRWQDLLMRLRGTRLVADTRFALPIGHADFMWSLSPSASPYEGLSLALIHPERLRIEGQRAYGHGCVDRWQLIWGDTYCGELQALLFFDLAWDIAAYRDPYDVERLMDQHYTHTTGLASSWSQLWNDYYDLPIHLHPEQKLSVESLRRAIGECQSLNLQLSLELNNKVVRPEYNESFFRTVEYPVNMLSTQIQHLCNLQLVRHGMATSWAVTDGAQRIQLLRRQLTGGKEEVITLAESSADVSALDSEDSDVMLYRSTHAIGEQIKPFEAFVLPLNHQAGSLSLRCSFMPIRQYGKAVLCTVTVDNGQPRVLRIASDDDASRQLIDLTFEVDPAVEKHSIVFRTTSDGVWLQRVWLRGME